ncbi:MAG: CoB--CoM heterodisulfide reductase iron-sulfur subunit B family protein [Promethearchaeota archaeon]
MLLYTGCTTPVRIPEYEASTKAVLEALGLLLMDIENANCCGAQFIESFNVMAHTAMSARILALAEKRGLDILAICGACSGSLKMTKHHLDTNEEARTEVNALLAEDSLKYTGKACVKHLLQVFREDIGFREVERNIVNPFSGIEIASHYGCHVTRPHDIMQVDNPEYPTILDRLVEIAGATPIDYSGKARCCGGPLLAMDQEASEMIGREKIENMKIAGAKGVITACAFCTIQLTQVQFGAGIDRDEIIPVLTLPQFLGSALNIDSDRLGLHLSRISPDRILASQKGGRL